MHINWCIIANVVISSQLFGMDNSQYGAKEWDKSTIDLLSERFSKLRFSNRIVDVPLVPLAMSNRQPARKTVFCPACKDFPLQRMMQIEQSQQVFKGSWCPQCDEPAYQQAKKEYESKRWNGRTYVSTEFESIIKACKTRAERVAALKERATLASFSDYDARSIVLDGQLLSVGNDTSKVVFNAPSEVDRKRKACEDASVEVIKRFKNKLIQLTMMSSDMRYASSAQSKGVTS